MNRRHISDTLYESIKSEIIDHISHINHFVCYTLRHHNKTKNIKVNLINGSLQFKMNLLKSKENGFPYFEKPTLISFI